MQQHLAPHIAVWICFIGVVSSFKVPPNAVQTLAMVLSFAPWSGNAQGCEGCDAPGSPALDWIKAGAGSEAVCASIYIPCQDYEQCTTIAVGVCPGALTVPTTYLMSHMEGMAEVVVDSAGRVTSASVLDLTNVSNNGYRQIDAEENTPDGGTYAFIRTGAFVGANPAVSGGYFGSAWYLMRNGSIEANTNKFVVGNYMQSSTSDAEICVAEWTNGQCGNATKYTTGDIKFSLYGYTMGSAFSLQSGTTHLGFRTKVSFNDAAFTKTNLKFNGATFKVTDAVAATTDLRDFQAVLGGLTLGADFPLNYNLGSVTGAGPTVSGSKTIKIRATDIPDEPKSFNLDYLIPAVDFQAKDKFFVYDPTISAKQEFLQKMVTRANASATNSGGTNTESTPAPSALVSYSHIDSIPAILFVAIIASCFTW